MLTKFFISGDLCGGGGRIRCGERNVPAAGCGQWPVRGSGSACTARLSRQLIRCSSQWFRYQFPSDPQTYKDTLVRIEPHRMQTHESGDSCPWVWSVLWMWVCSSVSSQLDLDEDFMHFCQCPYCEFIWGVWIINKWDTGRRLFPSSVWRDEVVWVCVYVCQVGVVGELRDVSFSPLP